jgi:hypothetical protein
MTQSYCVAAWAPRAALLHWPASSHNRAERRCLWWPRDHTPARASTAPCSTPCSSPLRSDGKDG